MKVSIITEVRLYFYNDNYYVDSSFLKIIDRYKNVFENIILFSRVIESDEKKIVGLKAIDKNICINNIGSIVSFMFSRIKKDYYQMIKDSDLVILRVPSIVSLKIYKLLKRERKKYMCEVMGCAFDAYWNHGFSGKIIAIPMFFKTKKIINSANYCLYVTKKFLQNRYPTKAYNINASNVDIEKPLVYKNYDLDDKNNLVLFTAAALNVRYKGQHYVIRAIKELKKMNINVTYYLAGKGSGDFLLKEAKKYNVEENVHILGMLNKSEVNEMMLKSDIYIQPSLQEGLPRSLIEAMNCGLVCMGARTAGIPELLDDKFVFKRKSSNSIVKCISESLNENFSEVGLKNMKEAEDYYCSLLDKKRNDFYDYIIKDVHRYEENKR